MTDHEMGICARIKLLRKEIGMTQTDFGQKIEAAQGYLTNIETGKRPATEKIIKIILLQSWNGKTVNEEWLRSGVGDMFIKVPMEDETAALVYGLLGPDRESFYNMVLEIIKAYKQLSPNSQKVVNELVENVFSNIKEKSKD